MMMDLLAIFSDAEDHHVGFYLRPISIYRSFLMPLQLTTFENILTKGEIAHDEHFPFATMF